MVQKVIRSGTLDRLAIALSGLCLAHCVVTTLLVALLASAGGVLVSPVIHEVGLACAIVLGLIALGWGYREHSRILPVAVGSLGIGVMAGALSLGHVPLEIPLTMLGVTLLSIGHWLNRKAVI
jgi:MerC mercury resistance protein